MTRFVEQHGGALGTEDDDDDDEPLSITTEEMLGDSPVGHTSQQRVLLPAPSSMEQRYRHLRDAFAATQAELQEARQQLCAAVEGYDRTKREATARASDAKLLKNEAFLYKRELSKTKAELAKLSQEHHDALMCIDALRTESHKQSMELQDARSRELAGLRDSVAMSVRHPIRDACRKPAPKRTASRPAKRTSSRTARPSPAPAEERQAKRVKEELAAVTHEAELLRKQNESLCRELESCNSDKDRYVQLLVESGYDMESATPTAAVSLEAVRALLGNAEALASRTHNERVRQLQSSLGALLAMWAPQGFEHMDLAELRAAQASPADISRHLSVEQHRIGTLQKLAAAYDTAAGAVVGGAADKP